jgi:hypothetical protein
MTGSKKRLKMLRLRRFWPTLACTIPVHNAQLTLGLPDAPDNSSVVDLIAGANNSIATGLPNALVDVCIVDLLPHLPGIPPPRITHDKIIITPDSPRVCPTLWMMVAPSISLPVPMITSTRVRPTLRSMVASSISLPGPKITTTIRGHHCSRRPVCCRKGRSEGPQSLLCLEFKPRYDCLH